MCIVLNNDFIIIYAWLKHMNNKSSFEVLKHKLATITPVHIPLILQGETNCPKITALIDENVIIYFINIGSSYC